MYVVVDTEGGEAGRDVILQGVASALSENPSLKVVLIGSARTITGEMESLAVSSARYETLHTDDSIKMEDSLNTIMKDRTSSMHIGYSLLAEDSLAGAFFSVGSTTAFVVHGRKILSKLRLDSVSHPPFISHCPSLHGIKLLTDVGANKDCPPSDLLTFAKIAIVYAQEVLGCKHPRVALSSNGEEKHKGNKQVQESWDLFRSSELPGFVGGIEMPDFLLDNTAEILVADGFLGNVQIKDLEGMAKLIVKMTTMMANKNGQKSGMIARIKAKIVSDQISRLTSRLKETLDPIPHQHALYAGFQKPVYKGHGSCDNPEIVKYAILAAKRAIDTNLTGRLCKALSVC